MKSIASSRLAIVYASGPLLVIADLVARSQSDPHRSRRRVQTELLRIAAEPTALRRGLLALDPRLLPARRGTGTLVAAVQPLSAFDLAGLRRPLALVGE